MALLALAFLMLRTGFYCLNVIWSPKLAGAEDAKVDAALPSIAILIPARNEAGNIGQTLSLIQQLQYPNLEVWVLDDHSTDQTASIVRRKQGEDSRIRLVSGEELPKGWLGKNWACHQLAQKTTAEKLLFIDADVKVSPYLLQALVREQERWRLALLSIFPDQELLTWGEKVAVPMMHQILLSLLPLRWVRTMSFPSMAAANGQVMFFEGSTYREQLFHQQAKQEIVEDIAIARKVKRLGLKAGTYLGNRLVSCRMYRSLGEVVDGFSKNLVAGFGNSVLGLFVYLSLTSWMYIGLLWMPWFFGGFALACLLLTNITLSWLSNRSLVETVLTHPFRVLTTIWIGWQSILRRFTGRNQWKGRNIYIEK